MALPLRRAKTGRIKDSPESSEVIQRFDGIRDRLLTIAKDGKHDYGPIKSSELAKLWVDLQHFMEDNFGVTAKEQGREWVMTRIPVKLFRDFSAKGALATIIKTVFDYKETMKWRAFNLEAKGKREENFDMFLSIERALQEEGFLAWPQIYFSRMVPQHLVTILKRKAEQHAATVVEKIEECTHVVIYDEEVDKETDAPEQEFLRTLELRPERGLSLVHWWYYPDSYDEWIPNTDVEGEVSDEGKSKPPYYVNCRYIRDVDKYNEWGNEVDYEVGEELIAKVTKTEGRPATKKPSPLPKKKPPNSGNGGGHNSSQHTSGGESQPRSSQPSLSLKKKSGGGVVVIPPAHPSPTVAGGEKKHESGTVLVGSVNKTGKVATKFTIVTKDHQKPSSDGHEAKKATSFKISRKRPATDSAAASGGGDTNSDNEPILLSSPVSVKKGKPPLRKEGGQKKRTMEDGSGGGGSSDKGLNLKLRIKRPDSLDGQSHGKKRPKTEAEARKAKARRNASIPEFASIHEVKGSEIDEVPRPTEDVSREALIGDMGGNTVRLYKGVPSSGDSFGDDGVTSGLSDTESMFTKKEPIDEAAAVAEIPIPTLNLPHRTAPKRARPLPHTASQFNNFFDASTIHPIEMQCLPEFFTGRSRYKTPETYMVYRQFMIREYESSPSEYLSFTDCRRKLAGDAGTILRVHQFLDQWGIINGQVPEDQRPPGALPRYTGAVMSPWANDLRGAKELPSRAGVRHQTGGTWTDTELQALVKAVIAKQDDWEGVASEVGSRDPEQCIMKLLSLPLEDKTLALLEQHKGPNNPQSGSATGGMTSSVESTSSKNETGSRPPLMKDLGALLAQRIHPQVVKAAMSAALQEVMSLKSHCVTTWTDTKTGVAVKAPETVPAKLQPKTEMKAESEATSGSSSSNTTATAAPSSPSLSNGKKENMDLSPPKEEGKDVKPTADMEVDQGPAAVKKEEGVSPGEAVAQDMVGTMEAVRQASSAAVLSLIGLQARALAEDEERAIQQILEQLTEVKIRKLEIKVQQVDEMEKVLEAERLALQHEREEVFLQRARHMP